MRSGFPRRRSDEGWGDKEATVSFRTTSAEKELFRSAAAQAGMELATWVRSIIRQAANDQMLKVNLLQEAPTSGQGIPPAA